MAYRVTWSDRLGPDYGNTVRILVWGACMTVVAMLIGFLSASTSGATPLRAVVIGAGGGLVTGALITFGTLMVTNAGGKMAGRLLLPRGSSCPPPDEYSLQDAMVMRSDREGALRSYEELIAARPLDATVRIKAADLYVASDPRRAAELFRAGRGLNGNDIYATHRLVDLYLGPLDDERAARDELLRLIERHPGSRAADDARSSLAGLIRSRAPSPS